MAASRTELTGSGGSLGAALLRAGASWLRARSMTGCCIFGAQTPGLGWPRCDVVALLPQALTRHHGMACCGYDRAAGTWVALRHECWLMAMLLAWL